LLRLYVALLDRFGPQRWWPGRTPYEISIGAVLAQHTAWVNAARAIAVLRSRRLLAPERVAALPEQELARVIRPAGTYRLKARRLLALTGWLLDRYGGKFDGMRKTDVPALRASLLAIPGLGPETVDAILLYAVGRPVFVADAYARRVLARHRLISRTRPTRKSAPGWRRTCRPIPRSSTSFTPCSLPSENRIAARRPAARRARFGGIFAAVGRLPESGYRPRGSAAGASGLPPRLGEERDQALGGVGDRQNPRLLAHLLELRGIGQEYLDPADEQVGREHRLRNQDRSAGALDEPRVRRLLVARAPGNGT